MDIHTHRCCTCATPGLNRPVYFIYIVLEEEEEEEEEEDVCTYLAAGEGGRAGGRAAWAAGYVTCMYIYIYVECSTL